MKLSGKIKRRYCRTVLSVRDYLVVRNFRKTARKYPSEVRAKKRLSPGENFQYKDETWGPIKNLNELLLAASMHRSIDTENNECFLTRKGSTENNDLIIDTPALENNWLCFYYNKPLPAKYVFEFNITIHSEFKEIQLAFRYKNLANRLRFLIRDNQEAAFEIIRNGIFYRHVSSKPCSLQVGKMYHIAIEIQNRRYCFLLDGKPILAVQQYTEMKFTGNQLCLILYNDTADSAVRCTVGNIFLSSDKDEI